jgi:copper chaperone CopZ
MKHYLSLVCACLAVCLACDQPAERVAGTKPNAGTSDSSSQNEIQLVSFKVEGMTCPSGCYPTVRSAIVKQDGVIDVALAPQKKEDEIDNPVVFVKYKGKLDRDKMFKAIERVGFEAQELPN